MTAKLSYSNSLTDYLDLQDLTTRFLNEQNGVKLVILVI